MRRNTMRAKTARSRINSLPLDLLGRIFMACLPSNQLSVMASSEAPLLLTRVCSRWRTVAHSTAALWADVHIVLGNIRPGSFRHPMMDERNSRARQVEMQTQRWQDDMDSGDDNPKQMKAELQPREDAARLPFVKAWLKRARKLPLHLSVVDALDYTYGKSPITDYILSLLGKVETLDLDVRDHTLQHFVSVRPMECTRLRIRWDGFHPNALASLRSSAPLLTELDIRMLECPLSSLPLPWDRLLHLTISYHSSGQCTSMIELLEVLRATPWLQTISIGVSGEDAHGNHCWDSDGSIDLVYMPSLKRLRLHYEVEPEIADSPTTLTVQRLFPLLETPALQDIRMGPRDLLRFLLSRPHEVRRQIRRVEVEAPYYRSNWFVQCLPLLPRLRHLVLWNRRKAWTALLFPKEHKLHCILDGLMPEPSPNHEFSTLDPDPVLVRGGPCPKLERLELRDEGGGVDMDSLKRLLKFLRRQTRRLDGWNQTGVSGLKFRTLVVPSMWPVGPWRQTFRTRAEEYDALMRGLEVKTWQSMSSHVGKNGWMRLGLWEDEWDSA
ncbi:hypothetical protein DFP72DRAFT_338329 [Ephemerocybe angulata]|uniref:F-box domain-containing protein n=1 Tax=Ephemerocybe angulata TaxID=980116 RepID=A0A8H6M4G3_9AGAR|nr:hypothetical protein DFP72DRAFT_338329 [Tulosesus angulatus]